MTNATPPPMGWYPDPAGSDQERYWDGERWTRNLRNPPDPQPRHGVGHVPETLAPVSRVPSSPRPVVATARRSGSDESQDKKGLTADGVPLAGWWWRALSTIIDALVVWIVVAVTMRDTIASIVHGYQQFLGDSMRAINAGANPADVITTQSLMQAEFVNDMSNLVGAVIVSQAIYQFIMLTACAGSVGQLICGLRVVTVGKGKENRRLVWWRALIRAAAWACVEIGNQFIVLLTPFSYLMPLWQRSRQTIHDAVAGTQVIRPGRQADAE
ncbi:RDD family protein [Cutibacterium sp. WCA-380-WT-3A]|uniref:RDD family protein n=1 Tax=Cutibacterium porci TaxID=2605781 RepID=A0A7K0J7K9_9ACTN|nr:RDD family protein [Cutibacterium porci]MSS45946.1 RDD family protein [Cutibacterium porci]